MLRRFVPFLVILIAAWVPAAVSAELVPVEHFARLPYINNPVLSPSGHAYAYRLEFPEQTFIAVQEFSEGKEPKYFRADGIFQHRRLQWLSDKYLLISTHYPDVRNEGGIYGLEVVETRVMSLNIDNLVATPMFEINVGDYIPQHQDNIISMLPDDPEHYLVSAWTYPDVGASVWKVSAKSGGRIRHEPPKRYISGWRADANGLVRAGFGVRGNNEYRVVAKQGRRWKDVSVELDPRNFRYSIAGFDIKNQDSIYVLSDIQGGFQKLYSFSVSSAELQEVIAERDDADVTAVHIARDGRLISVSYAIDGNSVDYFDQSRAKIHSSVAKLFPGMIVEAVSWSDDDNKVIFMVSSSDTVPEYFIFDGAARSLDSLSIQYPELVQSGTALATTTPFNYPARDGLEIPAYITLPVGYDPESHGPIPFIINPHGGPIARDYNRFDYWVQYFASRGWGVLQVNYRGSSGYGTKFLESGKGGWGTVMQDDVTDGVKAVISAGLADSANIAIVGGSYGGYAALMGAVKTPELYKAVVSLNGVTDLPDWVAHHLEFDSRLALTNTVGDLWRDKDRLRTYSPARRADEIRAPVLLVHATQDRNVQFSQSKTMAKALRKADRDYTFVELEGDMHWLGFSRTRLKFFQAMDTFLTSHLPTQSYQ